MSKHTIYSTTIAKFNYVMKDKRVYSLEIIMLIKDKSNTIHMLGQMKTWPMDYTQRNENPHEYISKASGLSYKVA